MLFPDFFAAARAVRAIAQAGLCPANCRILDPQEARNTGASDGTPAIMVLAFESADHPLDAWLAAGARMLRGPRRHAGRARRMTRTGRARPALWRTAFIRMPYARERMVAARDHHRHVRDGDHLGPVRGVPRPAIMQATEGAIREVTGGPGQVTCRFTHVYPDGPAPYFTFHALGRHGALLEQWRAIKTAASDALIAAGGTITHHHAVGREHRPWYDRQRPPLFAAALRASKQALDPHGMLNPGVLIDP